MLGRLKSVLSWIGGLVLAVVGFLFVRKATHKEKEVPRPDVVNPLPGESQAPLEKKEYINRKEQGEEFEKRLQKLLNGTLVFVLVLTIPALAVSRTCAQEPYIPKTYEEALMYYKEAIDLLQQYNTLYKQSEQANATLLKANEELRRLVEKQQAYIEQNSKKGRFGVLGGVVVTSSDPGVLIGLQYSF